ncbi:MAG: DUF3006 domain-containing protein [Christensenellales bacterium]
MKKYVIDRFELEDGVKIAFLESDDGEITRLPIEALPENACEGDVLFKQADVFTIDAQETLLRREKARALLEKITGKNGARPL